MGTEVCSENPGWAAASPRISFSHDLSLSDISPATTNVRRLVGSLPPDPVASADFDFSISTEVSNHDPSPADELFSDGKILPLPIKNSIAAPSTSPPAPLPKAAPILSNKGGMTPASGDDSDDDDTDPKADGPCRSFWRFGRSSSVGGGKARTSLICPFSLTRSKSTGSYPSPANPSQVQKPPRNTNHNNRISNPNDKTCYYYSQNKRGSFGNAMRISSVLNVPAPYIPRGGDGSGSSNNSSSILAYLLCNCKDKNMKRSAVSCSP